MKLPVIETSVYTMKTLSDGQELKFSPYTVKQEKVLLVALESRDVKQIIEAIYNVLEQCVHTEIDVRKLPQFEIENIFLNIRSKSVGEAANLALRCEECEHVNITSHDLLSFQFEKPVVDNKVVINDQMGVMLKYPTINELKDYLGEGEQTATMMIDIIAKSIDYIYDEEQIYQSADATQEELVQFIESMSTTQFKQMTTFVENIPTIKKPISFDCEKCSHHNDIVLEGLQSFFT